MHPVALLDIPALMQRNQEMLGREMLLDTRCAPESAQVGSPGEMLALAILIFQWNCQPPDGRGHSVKVRDPTFVGRASWRQEIS